MGILPSQIVVASTNAGVPVGGGAVPWLCIKPAPGANYIANHYDDAGAPSSNLRGGAAAWTLGLLHVVRHTTLPTSGDDTLWDAGVSGPAGHRMKWSGTPAGPGGVGATGYLEGAVGTATQAFSAMGRGTSPDGTTGSGPGTWTGDHNNLSGDVQLTAIAVDAGYSYPSTDRFWVNGRAMSTSGAPGIAGGWESTGPGTGPFKLGVDVGLGAPTEDYIIGMFLHLSALTDEEMFILRKNIELARTMTDVDTIGGGVVALDHIWDVAGAAMVAGTGTAAATWVSTGAVGGISLGLTGALDVVEVEAGFGVR